jgi:hypothetical protein
VQNTIRINVMKGKVYVECAESGKVLEDLGTIVYDSANRVFDLYAPEADSWAEKGYMAEIIIIDTE